MKVYKLVQDLRKSLIKTLHDRNEPLLDLTPSVR